MNEFDDIPELGDDQFWTLILSAKQGIAALSKNLESLSQVELIGFAWKFEDLAGFLYDEKYHQNQFSEDYLEVLCDWVVAQGKEFYERVLNNPDQMPAEVDYSDPDIDILYEVSNVYYDRFGKEIPPLEGA